MISLNFPYRLFVIGSKKMVDNRSPEGGSCVCADPGLRSPHHLVGCYDHRLGSPLPRWCLQNRKRQGAHPRPYVSRSPSMFLSIFLFSWFEF